MAFPTVEATASSEEASGQTSHTVSLPSGITSGDLLVVFFAWNWGLRDPSWPAGWTELGQIHEEDTDGGNAGAGVSVGYREADGTEGSTITVSTPSGNTQSAHNAYRISGAEDPATQVPEISTGAIGTTSTSPDPDALTPTGGAKDYLWLAACGFGTEEAASSGPTNYSNLQALAGGSAISVASAERQLNASSEDPGTFTYSSSDTWSAFTVAIHPAGTGGGGGTTQNVTATLAGTSTDSVGSIILNLTGTTTLAGTSTTGGAITTTDLVALTATLAGTSTDTAAVSLKEAITATLAGMSVDGGAVSIKDVVALAATLAGTSEDSAKVSLGPLVPGTYTTYDAVGIREDLQGKARGRSMSKRALETAEQQLNDLLNNR